MSTIENVAAQLSEVALPVLFADTCSLLDVIRAPMRLRELSGCIAGAINLRNLLTQQPRKCMLVVASFVPAEWQDHAEPTANDLVKHFEIQDRLAARFHESCTLLGIAPAFNQADYSNVNLADSLKTLSEELLNLALHLDPQDDVNIRAYHRAVRCIPPSKKGGEVKDCTIVEECLEVSKILRATGFQRNLVFCTSNSTDYQEGSHLHPVLAADLTTVGLAFANTLPWAIHELLK